MPGSAAPQCGILRFRPPKSRTGVRRSQVASPRSRALQNILRNGNVEFRNFHFAGDEPLLFNLRKGTSPGDLVRAVMEGVALNTRWSLDYVDRFAGRRLDPLTIVGGGARSSLWCQILADVLGRCLKRPHAPQWANARGAAFITAVALGEIRFEDIPELLEIESTFVPQMHFQATYERQYEAFLKLHRSSRGLFNWLAGAHAGNDEARH